MRDLLFTWPPAISIGLFTAQVGPFQTDTYERMGFSGVGILTTIFLWRHFQKKEEKAQAEREAQEKEFRAAMLKQAEEDKEERNRLLERLNATNEQQLVEAKESQRQLVQLQRDSMQIQRDSIKAQEDSNRSVKELIRKGHCPKTILPE